ncbi:energy transducer TonB [Pyxidicoccus sp. MSG2]|uniref:energy transducer TonB n=1 Tax=Pyxidicoccus sp. MSG2 TaxID=2996790 RepID=UPI00226E4E9D|nr:energy transducer TonB [Pyxidicoccus sp. MSG2]MCY1023264.1 energy transducer TonB [Pyxidicoccus sp. MSG2]
MHASFSRNQLAGSGLAALLFLAPGCAAHRTAETPPAPASSTIPSCTDEAKAAHVSGKAVIQCVIKATGDVRDCVVKKPVPLMTEHLVDALHRSKFPPVVYKGKPIDVAYTFTITLDCK